MNSRLLILFCSLLAVAACGPDLTPQKYRVKTILLSSYEEYSFTYNNGKIKTITGTDLTTLAYTYYTDSTSIRHTDANGSTYQFTQLSYSGSLLTKVKVKWKFLNTWYTDSVRFAYSGNKPTVMVNKNAIYQLTLTNGNLTNLKRGVGNVQITNTFDAIVNPLQNVYWLDPFMRINGFNATLQPDAIARYFSQNNLSSSSKSVSNISETTQYSYIYLHGILPKAINMNILSNNGNTNNIVFVFDIQYEAKDAASAM
ncbi:MAG: hypothetical protein HOP30_09935 [Cyclobacteriaceae bacterium]|nr:hypothetical protein [Cyclobacteriaceae bacterium]